MNDDARVEPMTDPFAGPAPQPFVAASDLTVPPEGRAALMEAFRDRLGAVELAPGFQRLEVWADQSDPSAFTMVSWWDSRDQFLEYMRSDDHRRSHERIPGGEAGPRPVRFRRFTVVAT